MDRRTFIAGATAAFLARPRRGRTQEMRRIAIVHSDAPLSSLYKGRNVEVALFIEGLEEHGWVEGENLSIERFSAEGNRELLPALARAVVSSGPDLIYCYAQMIDAIMAATDTIPVVSAFGDRVVEKYALSLARPGGNLTGTSSAAGSLRAQRLQLLLEVVPTIRRLAYVISHRSWERRNEAPGERNFLEYANSVGIEVVPWLYDDTDEVSVFGLVFDSAANVDGLLMQGVTLRDELKAGAVRLANEARLPTVYGGRRQYVDSGGLMYYNSDPLNQYRRTAWYVDQILRGADPGELPIEQPTKFDFIINLKTAQQLGITFPPSILFRATEVIE